MKNKKRRKIFIVIITVVFLSIAGVFSYFALSGIKQLVGVEVKDSSRNIETYNYYLRDNATEYQNELFNELKEICKSDTIDYEAMAFCVTNNYIADFYTWSNKKGSYDVGGMSYTNEDLRLNMYQKARDLYYCHLNEYINQYGNEKLLEVNSCTSELIKIDEFEMDDTSYTRYKVKATWSYKEGDMFADDMQNEATVYLILNEGRMEILEVHEPS